MHEKKSAAEKMGDWFRHILSCCDEEEESEEQRPALQISGPTNFRREDISIPGLTPEQQHFIREKAISDAKKMFSNLQPLRSSPSGHFATPDSTTLPSYEDFTTPRVTPMPSPHTRPRATSGGWDRVKAHSRKISNSLTKPLGYHSVNGSGGEGKGLESEMSKYEMRALMDPSRTHVIAPGKLSGESFSGEGSDLEDRYSGKGLSRI